MRNKLLFILILLMTILSCKDKNIRYKYFKDGKTKQEINLRLNKIYAYYHNGKLKYISDTDGKYLTGKYISYYKNGNIQDSGYYNKNIQIGTWFYYDKLGKINKICDYTYVAGKGNLLNQIIYFDKSGDTIKSKGHYYKIKTYKDTIIENDTFKFDVIIKQSIFNDSIGVLIGEFDSVYNIKDTSSIIRFEGKNNIVKCFYKSNKIGENIVRGVIFDHTFRNDSDLYRELFFSKKFFIKPVILSQ